MKKAGKEEINTEIDRLVDLKKEIGQKIALIANPDLRLLLKNGIYAREPGRKSVRR